MVFLSYLTWHYTKAPRDILGLLGNYMVGTWHRFLIARHFKTLFAPWHRVQPSDIGKPRDITETLISPLVDLYIRLLAAGIRLSIILIGLVAELIVLAAFIALFIIWLLWPLILVYAISSGVALL